MSAGQVVRYGIAGGASAATHLGLSIVLVQGLAAPALVASNVGFAASVVVSYLLMRGWVFRSRRRHRQAFPRFLSVVAFGGLLNTTVVFTVHHQLGGSYTVAQAIAVVLIPVSNLLLNRWWTFRRDPPPAVPPADTRPAGLRGQR